MNDLIYVDFHKVKLKNAWNDKRKKQQTFSYTIYIKYGKFWSVSLEPALSWAQTSFFWRVIIKFTNIFSGILPCYKETDYSHMMSIISNFLLVCNASIGTIIYGALDVIFRNEFLSQIKKHFNFILCFGKNHCINIDD